MAKPSKQNFCFKPWNEVYSHFDTLGPCCVNYDIHQGSFDSYLSSDELKNLKKQFLAGERPESCSVCWKTEASGIPSVRQSDNNYSKTLKNISISISNKCNFKCVMCNPEDSSAWSNDSSACSIRGLEPYFTDSAFEKIDWIINLATKQDIMLTVLGGEPFISDEYVYLLDQIQKFNLYEKISLVVTTNLSVKKYKHIDHLEHLKRFPLVELYASFDGDRTVGEYIRTGFVYSKFLDNFNHFREVISYLSTTVQLLNIYNLPNIYDFAHKNNKEVRVNFLIDPDYLSVYNLSRFDREQVLAYYQSVNFKNNEISTTLLRDNYINKKQIFFQYTKDLDLLWGRNLFDSIPELESII